MRFDLATVLASSYNEFGRIKTRSRNRSSIFVIKFKGIHFPLSDTQEGGGVLPYSLDGGVPLGSRKSHPLPDQILQIL